MRVHKFAQAAVAAASLVAASSFLTAPPAHAYSQTQARVVGTGGTGVGCRQGPGGPPDCGYGAPESALVDLGCFFRYGDPVGSNGNDLWWRVTYGGKTFFVADHWLDTPAPVNHSPAWYGGVGCQ